MRVLDVFSGIGGFALGLQRAGMDTIAFCEIEPFARRILSRHWPNTPIAKDIRQLHYDNGVLYDAGRAIYEGQIELICGDFPCQDISAAKHDAKGIEGSRSSLWKEQLRLVRETGAELLAENVAMLRHRGLVTVLQDIHALGMDARCHIIPAYAVGAIHHRERLFLYSYHRGKRSQGSVPQPIQRSKAFSWLENVRGVEDLRNRPTLYPSMLCRSNDGIPQRVDRLRGLGNAVVPQIVEVLGSMIMKENHA